MLTTKNQPHHRNEVSQNALFQNRMCFIYRKMTFLGQNLAENRKANSTGLLQQDIRYKEMVQIQRIS